MRVAATLLVIAKNAGGILPIAVGYVWRRSTAKVVRNCIKMTSAALLAPRKLGFGVTRRIETAVRTAKCCVDNMQHIQLFVKIDFKNAFNTLRRDSTLEAVTR
jgi:hypothetical protein